MTRWETFRLLGGLLRPAAGREPGEAPASVEDWGPVFEAASRHLVTPALAWSLRGRADAPADVADYLEAVLFLNRERNDQILDGLELAVDALAAAGITPLLLKGAGLLAREVYPDPAMRILGDLDMLVEEAAIPRASAALAAAGFAVDETSLATSTAHHHIPMQTHVESGVGVELHRRVLHRSKGAGLIDTTAFRARALPAEFRGRPVLVPSPSDQILHGLVHGQIVDGALRRGIPPLRQLLDQEALGARFGPAIDWSWIEGQFVRSPHARAPAVVRAQAAVLLGGEMGEAGATRAVARRMEERLNRPESARWLAALAETAREQLGVMITQPRRLRRLLSPERWRAQFTLWRDRVAARKGPW